MNFYQILEISSGSNQEEIKKAFRDKAKQYHPDVSTEANANEYFRLVYIAYDILKDPYKRALYDRLQRRAQNTNSRIRNWEDMASRRAHSYAEMPFEEFEDTLLAKLEFHGSQLLAFVFFFLILCMGFMGIIYGTNTIFKEDFNGSYVIGYLLILAGGAFSYWSFRALWGILSSWN